MTRNETNRRRFLTAVAGMGIVSTAGCLGSNEDDSSEETETNTDTPTDTNTSTDPESETDTQTGDNETETETDGNETTTESDNTPGSIDEYLADTGNYDGTVEDNTGEDSIDVMIGVQGNGPGAQAYDPAAMKVSAGTLVRWVWTGEGGRHNVVSESGEFKSGATNAGGHTYEYTLDEPGTYFYYCESHTDVKMRGAVVVTDS